MAEEDIRIIKIETEGSVKTVKDLKNEIKSLRDDLVNTEKGTKEYDNILNKLVSDQQKLTDVMNAGKSTYSAVDDSIKGLRNQLKSLNNVYDELSAADRNSEVGANLLQQIQGVSTQLKELEGQTGRFQRNVGDYTNAIKSVASEYTSQRSELKALRVELENLEPGTEAYNKAFTRAAEITHNIADQQEMLKYGSSDLGDQLSNLRGIAANMAAGFSAAQAAIGLFGGESEEVQQAMLKVQQAMAIVQGLEGLDGFIKRTEGLSKAIKNWTAQSKSATVQTTAQATATKAAATATNAETVATEGATVAQKGFNAVLKANPIGFVIGLLALLVANWKKVIEWLGKAVGGWDKVTKAMNKFKATISGVAKAISKVLLTPIKEAINSVTTLGKVLKDVFTLNWGEIGKDIKDGVDNSVNIAKDGYNVAANYAKGKEEEITRQQKEEARKRAEERVDELDYAIRLKKAQNKSDWEYTEEGQAMYKEYFDALEQMYKKDSKEYKEYQIEKASYETALAEKQKKDEEDAKKKEEEDRKKAVEAAKKAQEELKKIEQDYQSKVASRVGSDLGNIYADYDDKYKAFVDYYKNLWETLNKSASATDKKLAAWLKDYTAKVETYNDKFKANGERLINETKAFLKGLSIEEFGDFLKQAFGDDYWEEAFGSLTDEEKLEKWKKMVENMGKQTGIAFSLGAKMRFVIERNRLEKMFNSLVTDSIENSSREVNTQLNDEIIKLFQKTIIPNVDDELSKLQLEIAKKKIKLDFEIETGLDFDSFNPIDGFDKQSAEFQKAANIYENSLKQINAQLDFYQKTIDYVNEHPELIPSNEYKNALSMVEQLTNQAQQLYVDYYNTNAEIRDRYFAEDLQKVQDNATNEQRLVKKHYDELYTQNSLYGNIRRELSGTIMKYDIQAAEETYQIQKSSLEEQLAMYQTYLSDVSVAGEQRVEAEKMVAELIAEIEEGEVAHTREMNQLRIQSFQMWYSYVQDAIGGIGDLFGGLADYYEADIKAQLDHKDITEEQANDMYEKVKKLKIAEAIVNTISGAIGAYMQAVSAYPPPYGEILGGISAAAVTAAGMAQVAQIRQQTLGSSGGSSAKAMATPQTQVYQPEYVESPTGADEIQNLRNTLYSQPIRAFVVESDITESQKRANIRNEESTF